MVACSLGDPTLSSSFDLLAGIEDDEKEYLRMGLLAIRDNWGSPTAKQLHDLVSATPQAFPILSQAGSMSIGRKIANWGKGRHSASIYVNIIRDESNPSIPKYVFQLRADNLLIKYPDFMDILKLPGKTPLKETEQKTNKPIKPEDVPIKPLFPSSAAIDSAKSLSKSELRESTLKRLSEAGFNHPGMVGDSLESSIYPKAEANNGNGKLTAGDQEDVNPK